MRVVSLCPSTTKLIFDLGCGDQVVGVTRFCVHPASQLETVAKVGGTKNPSLSRILELKPDLVFFNEEENRLQDWEAIKARGVACHRSLPQDVDGSLGLIKELGRLLGGGNRAAAMIAEIERARREVRSERNRYDTLSWAYLIWRKPWMTVNKCTYISALISEAGGRNVFAGLEGSYPEISADQLRGANPNRVFLSSEPFPFKQQHIHELSKQTGLPLARFVLVDGELLSWHGSLTRDGLIYSSGLLKDAVEASVKASI